MFIFILLSFVHAHSQTVYVRPDVGPQLLWTTPGAPELFASCTAKKDECSCQMSKRANANRPVSEWEIECPPTAGAIIPPEAFEETNKGKCALFLDTDIIETAFTNIESLGDRMNGRACHTYLPFPHISNPYVKEMRAESINALHGIEFPRGGSLSSLEGHSSSSGERLRDSMVVDIDESFRRLSLDSKGKSGSDDLIPSEFQDPKESRLIPKDLFDSPKSGKSLGDFDLEATQSEIQMLEIPVSYKSTKVNIVHLGQTYPLNFVCEAKLLNVGYRCKCRAHFRMYSFGKIICSSTFDNTIVSTPPKTCHVTIYPESIAMMDRRSSGRHGWFYPEQISFPPNTVCYTAIEKPKLKPYAPLRIPEFYAPRDGPLTQVFEIGVWTPSRIYKLKQSISTDTLTSLIWCTELPTQPCTCWLGHPSKSGFLTHPDSFTKCSPSTGVPLKMTGQCFVHINADELAMEWTEGAPRAPKGSICHTSSTRP